jgi:hypothetical protein
MGSEEKNVYSDYKSLLMYDLLVDLFGPAVQKESVLMDENQLIQALKMVVFS